MCTKLSICGVVKCILSLVTIEGPSPTALSAQISNLYFWNNVMTDSSLTFWNGCAITFGVCTLTFSSLNSLNLSFQTEVMGCVWTDPSHKTIVRRSDVQWSAETEIVPKRCRNYPLCLTLFWYCFHPQFCPRFPASVWSFARLNASNVPNLVKYALRSCSMTLRVTLSSGAWYELCPSMTNSDS